MNERLVIMLVLSCVNIQFLIYIQSNKSCSQESVFFLAECSTAVMWGFLSDRFGRRPVLLLGPLGLAFSMLSFGSSTTYALLVISRFCQGSFNGYIGEYITWFYLGDQIFIRSYRSDSKYDGRGVFQTPKNFSSVLKFNPR